MFWELFLVLLVNSLKNLVLKTVQKSFSFHGIAFRHDTFEEANRKISVESYDSGYQDDLSNKFGLKKNSIGSSHHQLHLVNEIQLMTNAPRRSSACVTNELGNGNGCDKGAGRRASHMCPYPLELTQINGLHRHPAATYRRRESNFNCKFTVDLGS